MGPGGWSRAIGGRPGWAPRLAEAGYRAVVMTWPGLSAGGAWDPDTRLDGAAVAGAIVELIAALGGPVVLVVHSMSAAFGYRVAFHHRDSLIALVALAPAPPGTSSPSPPCWKRTPITSSSRDARSPGGFPVAAGGIPDQSSSRRSWSVQASSSHPVTWTSSVRSWCQSQPGSSSSGRTSAVRRSISATGSWTAYRPS
ncbi:alpha/beta hydrolase [Microbacterium schleiferi]|uniref:Alpha/beta hydrolase n=1 Tax=Microbacterium schleiferi TaxID=69362 RepID=A0A7S8RHL0_9MICO|nr:alpha/beta hydrolase [Microbacterium schleiferi]